MILLNKSMEVSMGTKSKGGRGRQVDFTGAVKMLSEMADTKQLDYTKQFTTTLSAIKLRMETLEDLLIEKLNETQDSFNERVMLRVEKNYGYVTVDTPVKKGSMVRIKVKEEVLGKESPDAEMETQYICVGHNQLHSSIDTLIVGAVVGETRDIILPDPKNATVQRKLTVLVSKVFKGEESKYETAETVQETPKAAQN